MKALAIWLAGFVLVVGGLSAGYHFFRDGNPARILVVVDGSFEMQRDWDGVVEALDSIDDRRYAQFALATEKPSDPGHGWQSTLELGAISAYGPRDFSCLQEPICDPKAGEASELILITNAPDSDLAALDDWTVIRP